VGRKVKTRTQNISILVVVEGNTEQIYFNQLRGYERMPGVSVIPKLSKSSSPYYVLKLAIEAQKEDIYDEIWCVFDRDVLDQHKPKDFDAKYTEALSSGIRFAESFPCFEVWYLLHYVMPQRYYPDGASVIADLCRHIDGYCKDTRWLSRNDLYAMLKPFQKKAIENSEILSDGAQKTPDPNATSSEIFSLVESILEHSSGKKRSRYRS